MPLIDRQSYVNANRFDFFHFNKSTLLVSSLTAAKAMSTPEQVETYKEFLNFDWDSFDEFQSGLNEILDSYLNNLKEQDPTVTSIPEGQKEQLVRQAKSFFYCTKTGNILSLEDFDTWRSEEDSKYDTRNRVKDQNAFEGVEELQIDHDFPHDEEEQPRLSYQELVDRITTGKPIPGIKQIPDVTLPDRSSVSTAAQRPKPWELHKQKLGQDEEIFDKE